jgi:hypothetical protein
MKVYACDPNDIIQDSFNVMHTELIDVIGRETDVEKRNLLKNQLFTLIREFNKTCRLIGFEPKHDTGVEYHD